MNPNSERRSLRHGMFQVPLLWAGRGRPVLFLHGAWGLLGDWAPDGHLARLAEHYLVLAPSHPGFDGATGLQHLDDILDLTIYYLDFLDELLLDSPYVIGHGLGGTIAAEMASLAPQRIAKLVLIAPYGLWLPDAPLADVAALSPDDLARAAWHDRAAAPPLAAQADRSRHAQNLAAAARFTSPVPDKGLHKRLHRLLAPTLLVWGEHDRLVPLAYGEAFHRRIAHSQLLVIPAAAHLPHLEQPETFARSVLEFLDG